MRMLHPLEPPQMSTLTLPSSLDLLATLPRQAARPMSSYHKHCTTFQISNPRSGCYPPVIRELSSLRSHTVLFKKRRDGCCCSRRQYKEDFSSIERCSKFSPKQSCTAALYCLLYILPKLIHFFVTVLQQMARADSMTVLLHPATGRQSLVFDSTPSFLSPDTANTIGNSSHAAAMLAQRRAKLKAAGDTTRRISAPVLA
ncbi:hypothetical protein EDB87DRAFT_678987 [Lactarius vividus]|nr:hypothetical protein EDB87DRAFT_678987 [Lactarius vividus]